MQTVDRTPVMTSNTAPSPNVVTVSSSFGLGYEGFRAFESPDLGSWDTAGNDTGWLTLDFGSGNAYVINQYKILSNGGARAPKDFTLQGSNDGSSWTTLDTQTGQNLTGPQLTYNIANTTAYRYYKLDVTAVFTLGNLVEIADIKFLTATKVKTVKGLALASVKTINGLAIASVKTANGLA